ncbi:MAG: SRPBCC domain-containing protein [Bacteriovorax sp.]|jgi:uncharacterized protein YndB with AHSA1/START domain
MKQTPAPSPLEHKHSSHDTPLIVITRIFQAPVEWVWRAWSDPEIIEQWWGPSGHMSKYACMEFREGGKYFLDMEAPDGSVVWSTGTYEEIVPYKKIVCTDSFADKDGNIVLGNDIGMPGSWPRKLYITIEFEEIETHQTRMVVSHEGIPKEGFVDCMEGWNQSLDKFQEVVERYGNENLNSIH